MGILGSVLRVVFLGGGISSVVLPSLVAAGYKDYDGHGKSNNTTNSSSSSTSGNSSSSVTLDSTKKKQISDNASNIGKSYGINVGRIPGKKKIAGKLDSKCKNGSSSSSTAITLGNDKGTVGRKNGKTNKNLFGEVSFNCQNKTGTLFLKGEGGSSSKQGGYGRVVLPKK